MIYQTLSFLPSSVSQHVDQLLLRLLVRGQEGGSRRWANLVRDVGGIQPGRFHVFGFDPVDDSLRRFPLRRYRLPHRKIHEFR